MAANACPECKLRGATVDWQRFGGCPHGYGYIGEPVEYDTVKEDCTCEYKDVGHEKGLSIHSFELVKKDPNCPQHGFKDMPSGPTI